MNLIPLLLFLLVVYANASPSNGLLGRLFSTHTIWTSEPSLTSVSSKQVAFVTYNGSIDNWSLSSGQWSSSSSQKIFGGQGAAITSCTTIVNRSGAISVYRTSACSKHDFTYDVYDLPGSFDPSATTSLAVALSRTSEYYLVRITPRVGVTGLLVSVTDLVGKTSCIWQTTTPTLGLFACGLTVGPTFAPYTNIADCDTTLGPADWAATTVNDTVQAALLKAPTHSSARPLVFVGYDNVLTTAGLTKKAKYFTVANKWWTALSASAAPSPATWSTELTALPVVTFSGAVPWVTYPASRGVASGALGTTPRTEIRFNVVLIVGWVVFVIVGLLLGGIFSLIMHIFRPRATQRAKRPRRTCLPRRKRQPAVDPALQRQQAIERAVVLNEVAILDSSAELTDDAELARLGALVAEIDAELHTLEIDEEEIIGELDEIEEEVQEYRQRIRENEVGAKREYERLNLLVGERRGTLVKIQRKIKKLNNQKKQLEDDMIDCHVH